MTYPTITNLPAAPSRQDPANFADEADAFLGALPTFQTEVNTAGDYIETKAGEAATSATNSANSATESANSATASANSATESANSASAAATSETNAAASEAAAAASFDSFDDRYLGSKAFDPATDNDGDPLLTGAIYYNTTFSELRIYDGAAWQQAVFNVDATGALLTTNNLSDLTNSDLALTNLGLTASATELNTLDGITASTTELNTLDGITASTTELNYVDGVTSNIQAQLDSISVTNATLTKSFVSGETATISLSQAITSGAPVVSVTKEVTQIGLTENSWDIGTTGANYTRHDTAYNTTLTPSDASADGTFTLGTGSFASTDVGKIIEGNGGEAIITATDGSYSLVTAFNDSSTIAAGDWSMYGTVFDATNGLELSEFIPGFGDIDGASYDSISFSVGSQEASPFGIAFNSDGTKMYILGTGNDSVHQYSLSAAFDLSTASYDSVSFSVSSEDTSPYAIAFNSDGTKMYMLGFTSDSVHQYSVPLDAANVKQPTAQYIPAVTNSFGQIDSTYWTDINSMTATQVLGDGQVYYAVSTDGRTTWSVIDNTNGVRPIVRDNAGTWEYNSNATYSSTTWTSATTNDELSALQQALNDQAQNRMDKTQLEAVTDANHYTLGNSLDLMIALYLGSESSSIPSSDGVSINYDAQVKNEGAVLGTDYDWDFPANDVVRVTSNATQNLKVRVV